MSAHDQMRNMIDQLMGTARDGDTKKYGSLTFDDARVCKSFLLKCCPHDILSSTRMDLGECSKIHEIALRADYEIGSRNKDYNYQVEAFNKLNMFIVDLDKKVELAKMRLKETQAELSEEANTKAESIHKLGEQIGTTLAKAEQVGAEGKVEESLEMLSDIEQLKSEKFAAEQEYRNVLPASTYQQQKLRVCEICSAYLGIHDNDRRLADHFGGKLHLGFIDIRSKLEELRSVVEKKREARDKDQDALRTIRELQEHEDDQWKNNLGTRNDDTKKPRSRSTSRSRNSRRRSPSRGSKNSRSRSRSRQHKSSSRLKRSRSRSNKHSSSRRHRRSRSHSKSRKSKSASPGSKSESSDRTSSSLREGRSR